VYLVLTTLTLLAGPAHLDCTAGCVCVSIGDARGKLERSEAAFVGRAIAVEGYDGHVSEVGDSVPYFVKAVTLVVERGWSGAPPDTVHASVDHIGPDCPTRFLPGQHYLVFTTLPAGAYVVTGCGFTSQVDTEAGQADVKLLGRPTYVRP
jgi:hypothetical protein